MLLAIVALGSTVIGATTIAGLLMIYQLRAAKDTAQSAAAISAADAGLEYGLYIFFHPTSTVITSSTPPALGTGRSVEVKCWNDAATSVVIPCDYRDTTSARITALGRAGNANRMFELRLK